MDHAKFWRKQADFWKGGKHTADYVRHCLAAASALDRLAALERELAEARKDGARLDWVIRNFEEVNFDGWHDHADMDAMDLDMEDEVLAAWRRYIDAAMRGE